MAQLSDAYLDLSDEELEQMLGINEDGIIEPAFLQLALADAAHYYPRLYMVLTGGVVTDQRDLLGMVENRISDAKFKMERYLAAIEDESNPYTLGDWQAAMMTELRNAHIQAYLAGLRVQTATG